MPTMLPATSARITAPLTDNPLKVEETFLPASAGIKSAILPATSARRNTPLTDNPLKKQSLLPALSGIELVI